jgi:hypothetical protein
LTPVALTLRRAAVICSDSARTGNDKPSTKNRARRLLGFCQARAETVETDLQGNAQPRNQLKIVGHQSHPSPSLFPRLSSGTPERNTMVSNQSGVEALHRLQVSGSLIEVILRCSFWGHNQATLHWALKQPIAFTRNSAQCQSTIRKGASDRASDIFSFCRTVQIRGGT